MFVTDEQIFDSQNKLKHILLTLMNLLMFRQSY